MIGTLRAICFRSFSLLLALLLPNIGSAQEFGGTVERVIDGDTVGVLTDYGESFRIRLADIDAPERDQPWGIEATMALSRLGLREEVHVRVDDTDRYGRLVATLFIDGRNLNKRMIEDGHAWVYRKYLRDKSLPELEEKAREAKKGLWANANAIEPSHWRRGVTQKPAKADQTAPKGPRVKKSRSNICHEAGSQYYSKTKNFAGFPSVDDCLKSGGRLPYRN